MHNRQFISVGMIYCINEVKVGVGSLVDKLILYLKLKRHRP
jgi:hypothetical protein